MDAKHKTAERFFDCVARAIGMRWRKTKRRATTLRTTSLALAIAAATAALGIVTALGVPRLHAQGAANQKSQAYVPKWQIDAGGSAQFDVASVKQVAPGARADGCNNVDTSGGDNFAPTGGLYCVQTDVHMLVVFAYKQKSYGYYSVMSQIPKWGNETFYHVEARAAGNPTKDQYRLMVQALLADRFKLKVHWELKQIPVMAVVLEKPGKLGPSIRPHSEEVPCPAALPPSVGVARRTTADGFPEACGMSFWSGSGHWHEAGRNVPVSAVTDYLMQGPAQEPFIDKTGLNGKYDIAVEWTPSPDSPQNPGFQPDTNGPTLVEALKNQLGFKLVREKDPVEVLVVDHVEEPTAN